MAGAAEGAAETAKERTQEGDVETVPTGVNLQGAKLATQGL